MRMIVAALAFLIVAAGAPHVAPANDKSATADANKTRGLPASAGTRAAAKLKALRPFTGKLVISPDSPPASSDELPAYLKGNLSPDGAYELIKGPPWPFHITLVLATATKAVTLVVIDKADAKAKPLLTATIAPAGDRKLVLARAEATIAAGFAAHKSYEVQLLAGKKVLAKAELLLRD